MPVAVPTRHPGKKTSWSDKNVMQITNATQMLPSADLMNSADGSSMSFPVWFYTMGVTYSLHFNVKTLRLTATWWKPQSKSAMPEKNFKLSAPIRCFPCFPPLVLLLLGALRARTPVKLLGNMTGHHIAPVLPVWSSPSPVSLESTGMHRVTLGVQKTLRHISLGTEWSVLFQIIPLYYNAVFRI